MDLFVWGRNLALVSIPLMLTACVSSSDHDALRAQVNQMSRQVSSSQTTQADSWSQLIELRQEVAVLRGQVDALNDALQQAGGLQKLADVQAVHDRALRLVESQMALDLQMTPAQEDELVADPQQQGLIPSVGQPAVPAASAVPAVIPAHAPAVKETPASQNAADMAQALYDSGMAAFNKRQYQASLKSFSDLTKTYPKHKLASNAWFWQGENNYQMKKYAEAALAYQNVIEGFPNSTKAPDSYLKQGMCFLQLDKKAAAKQRLRELVRKFPKAPQAVRAQQVIKQYGL